MKLIFGLIMLVAYHQTGEALMNWTGWPIPGSVAGMLLLFFSLKVVKTPPQSIQVSAEFLLRHMALLFVPAGVGMMLLLDLLAEEWQAMLVSMVLSTFIAMTFTAWLMRFLIALKQSGGTND